MLIRNIPTILGFFLGLLCIQSSIGRSLSQPTWGPPSYSTFPPPKPLLGLGIGADANIYTGLDAGIGFSTDISASAFSDILFNQLVGSNVFRSTIFAQLNADVAINVGLAIAKSMVSEIGLGDSYLATNLLTNALTSIGPGASPEVYCRALANVTGQLMKNNGILNSANTVALSNALSRIIIKAVSTFVYGDVGLGLGIGLGTGLNLGANLGNAIDLNGRNSLALASGVNTNVGASVGGLFGGLNADLGVNDATILGAKSSLNGGLGINAGLGIDAGLGLDAGLRTNLGLGAAAGLGVGANLGLSAADGLGVGANLGLGAAAGIGVGANLGLGAAADLGVGANLGLGAAAGLGVGANLGLGIGADVGLGIGANVGLGLVSGIDAGANLAGGTDLQVGVQAGLGTDLDLSVSSDAFTVFKSELTKELLKDNYFRYVFSDYVPSSIAKVITAAITQCLSKAFSIPRSYLLPLENSISNLPLDVTPSPELYVQNIVSSLLQCLVPLNLITVASAKLQASIAAKAAISGITNFLVISTIPGVGLGVNSNSYNSYFSALSGLEKLPYVGIDVVSSKLPPIVMTAKSSANALRFCKTLLYNLISSNKFSEVFLLGVPTFTYKVIANSLGKSMAEAFGSPFSFLLSKFYTKALFAVGNKLDYQIYARALSEATMNALYLLGYFSSGNVNIQAAIANNAIIQALVKQLKQTDSQENLFPAVLGLQWSTPIKGVAPPDSLLKLGIQTDPGVAVDVGSGIGVDIAAGLGVGVDAGLGLGIDAGLGLGVNAGLGVDADLGLNAKLGLGANTGRFQRRKRDANDLYRMDDINVDIDLAALELELDLAADAAFQAGVGNSRTVKSGLGVDADLGVNAGVGLGLNAGAGLGLNAGAGLGLNAGAGLGLNAGAGLDVNAGLGVGANLGLGLNANAGLGLKAGLGLGANVGITAGAGAGTALSVNPDDSKNAQLSILAVLPSVLANKLYKSTALYTAVTMTGSRKVINLIAQAMAAEFGFPIAALFLKSYEKYLGNNSDATFGLNVIALSLATTEALAGSGMLNTQFTVQAVDQLSSAVVAKYSSLIATSLDSKVNILTPKWTNLLAQEQFQPPLAPGYALL